MATQVLEPRAVGVLPTPSAAPLTFSHPWAIALMVTDLALFALSAYCATLVGHRLWKLPSASRLLTGDAVFVSLWILTFHRLGLYRRSYALRMRDELYYTVAGLACGIAPLLILFTILPAISTSRSTLLLALLFSLVLVTSGRVVMHAVRIAWRPWSPMVIIGRPDRVRDVLLAMPITERRMAATIDVPDLDGTLAASENGDPYWFESLDWFREARRLRCNRIILTEMIPTRFLPLVMNASAKYRVGIAFAPPRIQQCAVPFEVDRHGDQNLIVPRAPAACRAPARLQKRAFDVLAASVLLTLVAPLMVLCAIFIYLESGRPILYLQDRVGMGGRVFSILKFRSMRQSAESSGASFASLSDPRRTFVGSILRRLSFDELPQLWNVLRGEMSLVGPRPERPIFVDRFRRAYARYDERHLVRPGITGLAQLEMNRVLAISDTGQKLAYDLRYVEEWSMLLDLSLVIKTAFEFLFQRAA